MTDKLFSESTSDLQVDDNRNFLEEYVGEGKKFASVDDLAKGKFHSDMHITRLEQELAEMRKELKTRAALEDAVKRLETSREPSNPPNNQRESDNNEDNLFTPDKLEALLEAKLSQREQKLAQDRNFSFVTEELQKTFGSNYGAEVKAKCDELGISEEKAIELARTTPKAFLALVSQGQQRTQEESLFTPPSGQRTNTTSGSTVKGYKYYENLRKKIGNKEYFTPGIQMEIARQAQLLGEKFYST